MKQILLDTNFILSCIKQKIDFFEELIGFRILIPKQVIREIKSIINSKKKLHFREDAKLALKLLKGNSFKEIDLGKQHTDKLIIKFAEQHPKTIIGTLDREIKNKIKNQKGVIREKKRLKVI